MAQNVTGPVSEIVYIPLKTGFDVHGADKAVLHDCLGTIASQKGLKALFWGIQIEHPDVLQMIIGTFIWFTQIIESSIRLHQ